jgi:hypothetical protein
MPAVELKKGDITIEAPGKRGVVVKLHARNWGEIKLRGSKKALGQLIASLAPITIMTGSKTINVEGFRPIGKRARHVVPWEPKRRKKKAAPKEEAPAQTFTPPEEITSAIASAIPAAPRRRRKKAAVAATA